MADSPSPAPSGSRWKRRLGYSAFFSLALLVGLYVTFPYDLVKARLQQFMDARNLYVRMSSLGPGLSGITARDVQISPKLLGVTDRPVPAFMLKSVVVRPTLFPPGVQVKVETLGGVVRAQVGATGATEPLKVQLELDGLSLEDPELKEYTGAQLAGKVVGRVDLSLPRLPLPKGSPPGTQADADLSQASGVVDVKVSGLQVNGGSITLPMYGEATPVDLPKIVAGDTDLKINFDRGMGKVDTFHAKGEDLEMVVEGTLKLGKKLELSEPNLDLRLKTEPEFVKRLGMVGAALSMLGPDKKDPQFRAGKLTGLLSRPNFQPAR
ncbi:MAG: type II secretion system protein GspN [Deltaproteobacteria bacterium]|nr:type II secretion system protein GspN [Deltaproteobacteria bacterium]